MIIFPTSSEKIPSKLILDNTKAITLVPTLQSLPNFHQLHTVSAIPMLPIPTKLSIIITLLSKRSICLNYYNQVLPPSQISELTTFSKVLPSLSQKKEHQIMLMNSEIFHLQLWVVILIFLLLILIVIEIMEYKTTILLELLMDQSVFRLLNKSLRMKWIDLSLKRATIQLIISTHTSESQVKISLKDLCTDNWELQLQENSSRISEMETDSGMNQLSQPKSLLKSRPLLLQI